MTEWCTCGCGESSDLHWWWCGLDDEIEESMNGDEWDHPPARPTTDVHLPETGD